MYVSWHICGGQDKLAHHFSLTKLFESGSLVTYLCVCQTSCSVGSGEFSPLHLPSCHRDISITATKYNTRICFLLPLCCDKLQKQPGEKLMHFFLQLHGSRGRHSRPWCRDHGRVLLSGLLSLACSPWLTLSVLGLALLQVSWAFPHQSLIKKMPYIHSSR